MDLNGKAKLTVLADPALRFLGREHFYLKLSSYTWTVVSP